MHTVHARNVNDALLQGLNIFRCHKHDTYTLREVHPRGQRRLELTAPYATIYKRPRERVLFNPVRDCNPFFHMMESLWILAGREDVAWLKQWLPSIADYSDDGKIFHGAYGARLHHHDQVQQVINRLHAEPHSTRCVLQIYDAGQDAMYTGKDMPCNTTIYLQLRDNVLDLTVCNRSNDLVWGAYGANAVQFSMLQEYIAGFLGAECGHYVQFSNNTHIYPDNEATKRCLEQITDMRTTDSYDSNMVQPYPLMRDPVQWELDLKRFMTASSYEVHTYEEPFFEYVVLPMALSHQYYREGRLDMALKTVREGCVAGDWRIACEQWLQRRMEKRNAKIKAGYAHTVEVARIGPRADPAD